MKKILIQNKQFKIIMLYNDDGKFGRVWFQDGKMIDIFQDAREFKLRIQYEANTVDKAKAKFLNATYEYLKTFYNEQN